MGLGIGGVMDFIVCIVRIRETVRLLGWIGLGWSYNNVFLDRIYIHIRIYNTTTLTVSATEINEYHIKPTLVIMRTKQQICALTTHTVHPESQVRAISNNIREQHNVILTPGTDHET